MKLFLCSLMLIAAAGVLPGCSTEVGYSPSPAVYGPEYSDNGPNEYYDSYPYDSSGGFGGGEDPDRRPDVDRGATGQINDGHRGTIGPERGATGSLNEHHHE